MSTDTTAQRKDNDRWHTKALCSIVHVQKCKCVVSNNKAGQLAKHVFLKASVE